MPALAALVLDKQYDDDLELSEAILDAAYDSIVTYCNEKLGNNLLSVAKDALGADYSFDDDGAANYLNTLFEKQNTSASYNGGDISVGTAADAGWFSVDAINAAISITPERIGHYRSTFYFTHTFQLNATSEGTCETLFRITDGVTASQIVRSGGYFPAVAANAIRDANPVGLTCVFNWADVNPKTVTLQKWVKAATNVSANQVSATATTGEISMSVEKI